MYQSIVSVFVVLVILATVPGCQSSKDDRGKSSADSERLDDNTDGAAQVLIYGSMREAIGEQKHHGRVKFADLLGKPHFFGVAALEELKGEAAIVDGLLVVSTVNKEGDLHAVTKEADQLQATMLVGGYVNEWHEIQVAKDVPDADFDEFLAESAKSFGRDPSKPFLFALEGKFSNVRLHVINGACPVHSRMQNEELPAATKPFEMEEVELSGMVVGLYAKDAVGQLTQPATETHRHLVFTDADGQKQVGHIEQSGLRQGTKLRIAK